MFRAGDLTLDTYFSKLCTVDGAGVTHNAITDSSGGGITHWEYRPGSGKEALIHRLLVLIRDAGTFDAEKYGNLATLTNGIEIFVVNAAAGAATTEGNTLVNVTDPLHPIKSNAHWGGYCYDYLTPTTTVGDKFGLTRWTFTKAGVPLRVDGDNGEAFRVSTNDDLDGLVEHFFLVQGHFGQQ